MKKVINVSLGKRSFTIEDDAYNRLDAYLMHFRQKAGPSYQNNEVMEDIELRIAELFSESTSGGLSVVDLSLVERVVSQLGMPDGSAEPSGTRTAGNTSYAAFDAGSGEKAPKKFYRDSDSKMLGGVCGGMATYFDADPTLVRILFAVLIFSGLSVLVYFIFWIVTPLAETPAQKCELRGIPATAENMAKFS